MYSRGCECPWPQVFADRPEACHKCGRDYGLRISASTWRLALAIAEVAKEIRRIGDNQGKKGGRRAASR